MFRALPLIMLAVPAASQETVGTVTATVAAEEMTFVVVEPGDPPASGFERQEGAVDVRITAMPDRTPVDATPVLTIRFSVTGMGPTAEPTDATVTYAPRGGETLRTGEGTAEVSLTAFGLEDDEVTVSGDFASQLHAKDDGLADLAIDGDFQASLRQADFAESG